MWWAIAVLAILAVLGVFEWRSRNKPLVREDDWGAHFDANFFRPITGGHDVSERRD